MPTLEELEQRLAQLEARFHANADGQIIIFADAIVSPVDDGNFIAMYEPGRGYLFINGQALTPGSGIHLAGDVIFDDDIYSSNDGNAGIGSVFNRLKHVYTGQLRVYAGGLPGVSELYDGAQFIAYSDQGATEKARIDGATGHIKTVLGVGVAPATARPADLPARSFWVRERTNAGRTLHDLMWFDGTRDVYVSEPPRTIKLWFDAQNQLPYGWQLCDGTNGSPDLRGAFVKGATGDNILGARGGSTAHQHNKAGSHSHTTQASAQQTNANAWPGGEPSQVSRAAHTHNLSAATEHQHPSAPNEPPYASIYWIFKL